MLTLPRGEAGVWRQAGKPAGASLEVAPLKYNVSPLTCGRCVRRITEALQAIDSAARVEVDLAAGTVEAEGFFDVATVVATLAANGYEASPASSAGAADIEPAGAGCCGTCHA